MCDIGTVGKQSTCGSGRICADPNNTGTAGECIDDPSAGKSTTTTTKSSDSLINRGQDQSSCHHSGEECSYKGNVCCTNEKLTCLVEITTQSWSCLEADKMPPGANYSTEPGADAPLVNPGDGDGKRKLSDPPCKLDGNGVYSCDTGFGFPISTNPASFVSAIFQIVLSISGGIALLLIIFSGYKMVMSRGNPEKIQEAREKLTSAIVGLLFIIFSIVILQIIGVDILKIQGFN